MTHLANVTYAVGAGQPIVAGKWPGGRLGGGAALSAIAPGGMAGAEVGLVGDVALSDIAPNGSFATQHPLAASLDLIAAAATNTWVRLNAAGDTFIAHQVPNAAKALYPAVGGPQHSSKILLAWSSMYWDDSRGCLVAWGGGHANTNENSVYYWDAATRQWAIGFYPSATREFFNSGGSNVYSRPVDTVFSAPTSAHTFGGMGFAPTLNRGVIFPAANHTNSLSANYMLDDASADPNYSLFGPNWVRWLGLYTLDMAQAGTGKVGGTTGSNPDNAAAGGSDRAGAQAWQVRDWGLDHPTSAAMVANFGLHQATGLDVVQESALDTLYFTAANNSGVPHRLYRIQLNGSDYRNDVLEQVGAGNFTTGAASIISTICVGHNLSRRIVMGPGTYVYPIQCWDLTSPGSSNTPINVPVANISGTGVTRLIASLSVEGGGSTQNNGPWAQPGNIHSGGSTGVGCLYDPGRGTMIVASFLGDVIEITPPASGSLSTGWTATLLADASASSRPPTNAELQALGGSTRNPTNVGGKWKRAPSLGGAYLYLTDAYDGQVWAFKPAGWIDPRA